MLINKRKKFKSKTLHTIDEKYDYIREMFQTHEHLFEYPDLIKGTPVKKIEINKEQVIFTINNNGRDILLCSDPKDANSLPFFCINFSAYDEAKEMKMVMRLLKKGDVVFDIGASVGWYAINILLSKKGVVVYCFEPIKSSYSYLIKNFKLNNLKNDKVYNIGLSDGNKKTKFYFDVECAMASSMADLRESPKTIIEECKVKKLDDFVSKIPSFKKLDFIKCDVEGSELLVFKGGIKTIKKYKPIIFAEMLRKWSKKFNYHPNDIINLLSGVGYECYIFNNPPAGGKIKKIKYVDENTIEKNYLFLHKGKHANLAKKLKRERLSERG